MSRYLVTGGAGFIGSHLCESFLKQGHEVLCMDNYSTGAKQNIGAFLKNPRFRFIDHNVSRYIEVQEPLDYILHFASPASPVDYLELPIPTLKVGALGTHNTLGLAKAKNAIYLLASTSEVYGDPLVRPQNEEYWGNVNPIGPRGVYDEAKRFAEAMTMAYHRFHGLNTRIVRIFNTYGPRMRLHDGRVVPNFIMQALKGEPLTVYGQGQQTRSFQYVDDLVNGINADGRNIGAAAISALFTKSKYVVIHRSVNHERIIAVVLTYEGNSSIGCYFRLWSIPHVVIEVSANRWQVRDLIPSYICLSATFVAWSSGRSGDNHL